MIWRTAKTIIPSLKEKTMEITGNNTLSLPASRLPAAPAPHPALRPQYVISAILYARIVMWIMATILQHRPHSRHLLFRACNYAQLCAPDTPAPYSVSSAKRRKPGQPLCSNPRSMNTRTNAANPFRRCALGRIARGARRHGLGIPLPCLQMFVNMVQSFVVITQY